MSKMIGLMFVLTACGSTSDAVWHIDLDRTSIVTTGDVTCPAEIMTSLVLTVDDPEGWPVIVEDSLWSCAATSDGVLCAKSNGIDTLTLKLTPSAARYTYNFNAEGDKGTCTYLFGSAM